MDTLMEVDIYDKEDESTITIEDASYHEFAPTEGAFYVKPEGAEEPRGFDLSRFTLQGIYKRRR